MPMMEADGVRSHLCLPEPGVLMGIKELLQQII